MYIVLEIFLPHKIYVAFTWNISLSANHLGSLLWRIKIHSYAHLSWLKIDNLFLYISAFHFKTWLEAVTEAIVEWN